MQVICLKSTSPKAGGHKAGQVLDLPEETVLGMPDFYRPVGDELAIQAAQQRAQVAKAEQAHEDRIARKSSMARAEADRKSAEADILMKEAALRLQLAEEAKRQALEASERADSLAASQPAREVRVDLPPARTDSAAPSLPPHKRNRQ